MPRDGAMEESCPHTLSSPAGTSVPLSTCPTLSTCTLDVCLGIEALQSTAPSSPFPALLVYSGPLDSFPVLPRISKSKDAQVPYIRAQYLNIAYVYPPIYFRSPLECF